MNEMKSWEVQKRLVDYSAANSGHDADRDYLGMSQINKPEAVLVETLRGNGWVPSRDDHLRLYIGYMFQEDVMERLFRCDLLPDNVYCENFEDELVADFDDRFRGHIDGYLVDGSLLEIKSVTMQRLVAMEQHRRIRASDYEQVQCYLHHSGRTRAVVIYIARDTGAIWCKHVAYNAGVAEKLNAKAQRVLALYDQQIAEVTHA